MYVLHKILIRERFPVCPYRADTLSVLFDHGIKSELFACVHKIDVPHKLTGSLQPTNLTNVLMEGKFVIFFDWMIGGQFVVSVLSPRRTVARATAYGRMPLFIASDMMVDSINPCEIQLLQSYTPDHFVPVRYRPCESFSSHWWHLARRFNPVNPEFWLFKFGVPDVGSRSVLASNAERMKILLRLMPVRRVLPLCRGTNKIDVSIFFGDGVDQGVGSCIEMGSDDLMRIRYVPSCVGCAGCLGCFRPRGYLLDPAVTDVVSFDDYFKISRYIHLCGYCPEIKWSEHDYIGGSCSLLFRFTPPGSHYAILARYPWSAFFHPTLSAISETPHILSSLFFDDHYFVMLEVFGGARYPGILEIIDGYLGDEYQPVATPSYEYGIDKNGVNVALTTIPSWLRLRHITPPSGLACSNRGVRDIIDPTHICYPSVNVFFAKINGVCFMRHHLSSFEK